MGKCHVAAHRVTDDRGAAQLQRLNEALYVCDEVIRVIRGVTVLALSVPSEVQTWSA